MPSEITLPQCLIDAAQHLFPTLEWRNLHFFLGIPATYTLPRHLNLIDQDAMVLQGFGADVNIHFKPEAYAPCTADFFELLCHELVHALQVQEAGKGAGRFGLFTLNYVTCWLRHWEYDRNKFEVEAKQYEERLAAAMSLNHWEPCVCNGTLPGLVAERNPIPITTLTTADQTLIKKHAEKGGCRGRAAGLGLGEGGWADFWNILGHGVISGVIGLILGAPFIGFLTGIAIGFLDKATGIPSATVALASVVTMFFIDLLIGGLSSLADLISPGDRPLKMVFSQDDGDTFNNPTLVGMTREPPALAYGSNRLHIAWLYDGRVQLASIDSSGIPSVEEFSRADDDSGPALAVSNHIPLLVWQREDHKLFICSRQLASINSPVEIGGKSPDDATPGVVRVGSRLFVAWIRRRNNKIGIKSSANSGVTWGDDSTLDYKCQDAGSIALATDGSRLFLAFAARDSRYLRVFVSDPVNGPSANFPARLRYNLDVKCHNDTGPALAFGNNLLFLAWIGVGERVRVRSYNVAADGSLTVRTDRTLDHRSRDNAGPALTYAAGVLCLAWVRKNN